MSIVSSILTGGVNNHATTNEEANALSTDFVSPGVVGTVSNTSGVAPATGGYAVNATGTPDANVQISAGTAYVTATPSTQGSQTIRLKNSATITQAISANSSGSTKYDWVYLSVDATNANAPNTAGDNVGSITVSRSSSAATDDGTPPTYAILLAVVTVANGFSTITNSVIRDRRTQTTIGATSASPDTFWTTGGLPAVSSVTENGNRSANITFASTVASILTPGMRLRTSRTVAAPTQCTSLNGSTQYYSKTTPNKLTFTDDYTTMAWVYLTSYGAESGILGRRNADVEGFSLGVNSSGQLFSTSLRIAANNSQTVSYQSIPLNKWVHVAATTDLSGTSVLLYIDGVLVLSATTITGTITALVQGTTALVIGALKSAGTSVWPGKIAQVAIFNSVLSASTIRSYKNQGLSGSESGLQSAYSFNNSIADLNTTTPNDLTAQGSAVATNADSPFTKDANGTPGGTYDWAIVTKVATTVATVQYPEGCAIPTSGGISTVDYSGVASPFGMPVTTGRWEVTAVYGATSGTVSISSLNQWFSMNSQLTIPVGDWQAEYQMTVLFNGATNIQEGSTLLAPATPTNATRTYDLTAGFYQAGATAAFLKQTFRKSASVSLSAATAYLFYVEVITNSGATTAQIAGSYGLGIIKVVPAHL